jgi:hypothetical protein
MTHPGRSKARQRHDCSTVSSTNSFIRPHARPVPVMPPSQNHALLSNTGRSSDSRARPVAAFSPAGRSGGRQAMAHSQPVSLRRLSVTASGIARTQRRGRPGITPEFPVCRPEQLLAVGHQARVAECTGRADRVKHCRMAPHNRQGLPRLITEWKNEPFMQEIRMKL